MQRTMLFALMAAPVLPSATAQEITGVAGAEATSTVDAGQERQPVRTDSPRDTLETFIRLRDDGEQALLDYRANQSFQNAARFPLIGDQLRALIDLSSVPRTSREETGSETVGYLLDIFGRVALPDLEDIPDEDAFRDEGFAQYRIPGTPIRITRIGEGDREGEFLFNARTVRVAPRFYQSIRDMPLRSALGIGSWSASLPQMTGPLIPVSVIQAMPRSLRTLWLDTPVWKVVATTAVTLVLALLLAALHRQLSFMEPKSRTGAVFLRLIRPVSILFAVALLIPFVDRQINTSGRFSAVIDTGATLLIFLAFAWLFWLAVQFVFEWIIRSPRISEESLDANLLRLVARLIGIVGVTIVMAYGGQAIGLPIVSVLAGLGIGGIAVALAIRPTLENLIGGMILYIDKPVRVGDFCSFGERMGTVEAIGVRSTQLRSLDRTLISVPNAQFADMQIVNWARCDEMLIDETIGVRYETTPDQLRYLLAKMREMLHGHPRINNETVRVRFSGYGDSALNITIRIYAKTREWNDYFAIREDVFLRIYDLVTEAGTGFAFPSQTIYMGKDDGLDTETGQKAEQRVKAWRRSRKLPFPRFAPERLDQLNDTLDYPPRGSPEAGHEDLESVPGAERLSADPVPGEDLDENPSEEEDNKTPARD